MITPSRLEKLQKEFEESEKGYEEFKIGELFKKIDSHFTANRKFNKNQDVSPTCTKDFCLPLVNAKHGDNGVMFYGRPDDWKSTEMSIDIVNDGAVSTGDVYPQPQNTAVLYNAYLIKPKQEPITREFLFYCASAIQKSIKKKFSYELKATWERVKEEKIILPSKDKQPDFDYINSFISELEAERVGELEAYLKATDLNNYSLTNEEREALNNIESLKYESFNLEDLFGKSTRGKRLKSEDRIPGSLPFVTAGESDEGVSDFIGNSVTIFSRNTTTIDMFGSAKYRNFDYGGDDHIAVVHTENLNENAAIFITSAIHKSSHNGQFNYGRNFYAKDADKLDILLPARDGLPDYEFMAKVISAVKKLVIKDVVEFAEKKISATRQVIGK